MTEPTTPGIEITSIGGSMPTQAEGKLCGHPFYYRSRYGHWRLSVSLPGSTLDDLYWGTSEIWAIEGDDGANGCVPIPWVMALIWECYNEFRKVKIDEAYLQNVKENQVKRIEDCIEAVRNGSIEKHLEAFRNRKGNKP